jgi:hypothetical protein
LTTGGADEGRDLTAVVERMTVELREDIGNGAPEPPTLDALAIERPVQLTLIETLEVIRRGKLGGGSQVGTMNRLEWVQRMWMLGALGPLGHNSLFRGQASSEYAGTRAAGEGLRGGKLSGRIGHMIRGMYRMTPRQFRKGIEVGVFGERHVELLGGIPFVMSENPPHILCSANVHLALSIVATLPQWFVNKEHRLELGQWLPLPDAVVLHGPRATYGARLARADDVALLVEVADRSYARDSGLKLRRYATFGISVYWIVDLNRRMVEVRSQPFGKGKQAGYARCDVYQEHDLISVVLDGNVAGQVTVSDLLP